MTDKPIKLGYDVPDGTERQIPLFHTVITGITRHGKSEALKALSTRAREAGYTILGFDVKNPRDYEDIGTDIPIYLSEATDPTTLKGLLENQSGISLSFQFSELIKMYEPGDTYSDMLNRIQTHMADDVHPVEEDKLRVLEHLLSDLTDELERVDIADSLDLQPGINVMDLHDVDDSIQQLAIAGSVQHILNNETDTIVLLDEAHNFIPQRGSPPARDPLVKLIREGGAGNNWLWIADQTVTGIDKDPLKQVGFWILGKQRETNEADRMLDQIPGGSEYSADDIMTLDTGHFVVALDDAHPLVYAQPLWLSDRDAQAIASGETDVESADKQDSPDTETMTDALEEKEAELREKEQRIQELQEQLQQKQSEIEELERKIDSILSEQEQPEPAEIDEETVREMIQEEVESFVAEYEVPESVTVNATQTELQVKHVVEPIEVSTENILGKVAYLYAEGELPEDNYFTTGDVDDLLDKHGWDDATVKRKDTLNKLCEMGFLEMKYSGRRRDYKVVLSPEEARERGLLKSDLQTV